jgi:GNAT superfamily N-acetyltransferase
MTMVIGRVEAGTAVTTLRSADEQELLAMHERCSAQSRYRRWHGHVRTFPRGYLAALLAPTDEQLGVVARRDGQLIGFASAARVDSTTRELGILVEDSWQRHGIGGQLLTVLVAECIAHGTGQLRAEVLADYAALLEPLRTLGPMRTGLSHGVLQGVVELRAS